MKVVGDKIPIPVGVPLCWYLSWLSLSLRVTLPKFRRDVWRENARVVWLPGIERYDDTRLTVFTALHVRQTRYSDENSVCLSVRPSVTRVNCDKTEERSVQIFIPYER